MIVAQFIFWYLVDVPKKIIRAWKNYLLFCIEYFSIILLLKTFFSHWRRYIWEYPRGFDLAKYSEVFFSNLISRTLGAVMRSLLILIGIFAEILIFFAGAVFLLSWFLLPFFIFILFLLGIRICLS